ncbi:MAG TPA: hypothetical protein VKB12_07315, partial [Pyrinomonadaceae bacterium]|nr:hypothetical protein [Pyrinomonadaceae bacterium]
SLLSGLMMVLLVGRGNASPPVASAGAPEPFRQIVRPWTALGSTGAVDESSQNLYNTVSTEISFRAGAAGNVIVARYNVTNTFDNNANPNQPGWTTLEMGSNAPNSVIIEAKLFEVTACAPAQKLLCTATNRSNDHPCARCQVASPIDFTKNLYYVEVTLDRSGAPAALPRMFTLRIF